MINPSLRPLHSLNEHPTLLPDASTLLAPKTISYVMDAKKRTLQDICEYLIDCNLENGLYDQLLQNGILSAEETTPIFLRKRTLRDAICIISIVNQSLPQVELLIKVSHLVIRLYEYDDKSDVLRPLPSLIGLTGMISLFHQFAAKKIPAQAMWDNLDRLLPVMSQLPYLKTSRSCSEEAINELTQTVIPDNLENVEEFLLTIRNIQQIIIRYPIIATLDHIKSQLEKYQRGLEPSLIETLCYAHYDVPHKQNMYETKVDEMTQNQQMKSTPKTQRKQREKTIKPPKPPVIDENGQVVKKKKRRFSEEETQNLIKGVDQFGVGHWKMILLNYKFDDRSCVDLKDKWRNLEFSRMRSNRQKQKDEQMGGIEMEGLQIDTEKPPTVLPSVDSNMQMADLTHENFKYNQSD